MSKSVKTKVGGPSPESTTNQKGKTAEGIVYLNQDKDNPFRDRLLARTIACRPPNEDRLRGIS